MRPPVRSPQLRCVLFPSMYLPHLLVLPATFGLQCLLPPYPYFRAFYAVPVRQVRGLLTASFRFHLAMDTLAVRLCASSLPTRTRDFHPLENAHAGQTKWAAAISIAAAHPIMHFASSVSPEGSTWNYSLLHTHPLVSALPLSGHRYPPPSTCR